MRLEFCHDKRRQEDVPDGRKETKRAGLVQVQHRSGVGDKTFHLPTGFSLNAQATSCNCCCSINGQR